MPRLSTARFAAALAVVAALFVSGLVVGAAGDPLILGSLVNNSGASGTKVTTSVNGNAFAVSQTGAGASANGIRGDANTGTGGVFTSSSNNALFASVASGNRFAMVAVNSGTAGTGGGLLALGNANPGLVVDVDSNSVDPIEVNSTGLVDNLNSDLLDGFHAADFSVTTRDQLLLAVPFGDPLQSISIDQVPSLAGIIGSNPTLATVADRNVFLQASASVLDTGINVSPLLVWIGDAELVDGTVTWPIRVWWPAVDPPEEYTRAFASTDLLDLVVIASATR